MRRTLLPLALAIAAFLPFAPAPTTTLIFTLPGHHIGEFAATRDGNRIYYERDSADVYLYDRRTRTHTKLFAASVSDMDLSARGDRLAFIKKAEDDAASHVWTIALDPATGRATGDQRRVSLTGAVGASISPDSRWIAFATGVPNEANDLVVAPAAGGPERIVAAKQGSIWPMRWTPDGKWIYYGSSEETTKRGAVNAMMRVAVDGGKPERVLNTADWGAYPGLSPDGRSLLTWSTSWDTIVVSTPAGKRVSEYRVPAGAPTPDLWIDGTRALGSTNNAPSQVHVLSLADGAKRFVSDSALGLILGRWSPDGRRIAAMPGLRAFKGIAIIDDAGRVTKVPTRETVNLSGGGGLTWSPDGQRVTYRTSWMPGSFSVVDLATGRDRALATGTWNAMGPGWTANGRSVIYAKADTSTGANTPTVRFHEAVVDGPDRVLRTVRSQCAVQREFCYRLLNDSIVLAYAAPEYRLLNLRDAKRDTLLFVRSGTEQPFPMVSANNKWIAIRERNADGSWVVNLLSSDGAIKRRVALPAPPTPGGNPWVSNDGAELVVTALPQGGTEIVVYRLNVATGAASKLATIPFSPRDRDRGVSPDGKSILYGDQLERRASIYEFDMSALVRR
jgi:Tol biopolymer transport system component